MRIRRPSVVASVSDFLKVAINRITKLSNRMLHMIFSASDDYLQVVDRNSLNETIEQRLQRFNKLGTIDLRVDYLRPGIGAHFTIHAQALRVGSRVGSSRMEFRGPDGTLMSTGAAAYIVS